jgi:hypothetical protein
MVVSGWRSLPEVEDRGRERVGGGRRHFVKFSGSATQRRLVVSDSPEALLVDFDFEIERERV